MILATARGDRELRVAQFGSSMIPSPGSGWWSSSGVAVTPDQVYGMPAVADVLQSIAGAIASLSLLVYRGKDRATETWQYKRLHDSPAEECSSFDFLFDLALSVEASGNAFVQKAVEGNEVMELYVLDPQRMRVYREGRDKRFDYWMDKGKQKTGMTTREILHIRGFATTPGAIAGVSRLQLHRDALGSGLAMQRFEGHFWRHGVRPSAIVEWPNSVTSQQGREWLDLWNSEHAGIENVGKAVGVGAGGKVTIVPVSLEDALFADVKRLSVEDVARIWHWPKEMLEVGENQQADEQLSIRLLKHYLFERLRRIESAIKADRQFFPEGSPLFPEFLTDSLLRAENRSRYAAYKDARQAGWMTSNEIRERENLPAHPDGDILQVIPVGGGEPKNPPPDPESQGVPEPRVYAPNGNGHGGNGNGYVHDPEHGFATVNRVLEMFEAERQEHEGDVRQVVEGIPAPVVNVYVDPTPIAVNVEPTPIRVEAPAVSVAAPEVSVNVEPTPVTVAAPEQLVIPAPEVSVNVQPAEVLLDLNLPDRELTVERDASGKIKKAKIS